MLIALEIFCSLVISQEGTEIGSDSFGDFSLDYKEQKCSPNSSMTSFGFLYTCLFLINAFPPYDLVRLSLITVEESLLSSTARFSCATVFCVRIAFAWTNISIIATKDEKSLRLWNRVHCL